jgi:hypothetical protein
MYQVSRDAIEDNRSLDCEDVLFIVGVVRAGIRARARASFGVERLAI